MNDLDLFEAEIRKTYGDKDREMNAVMRGYQEFYQGHQRHGGRHLGVR